MTKNADPIDLNAGRRLREFRKRVGLSQAVVGAHLGVSFQQIQKYENGTNRISSSSLARIAAFLGVPIKSFFDDEQANQQSGTMQFDREMHLFQTDECRELTLHFTLIRSPQVRRAFMGLVKATAAAAIVSTLSPREE